ncbi:ABC-type antimicrobial peptide transport system, ATPase component [Anaerolinea thermolimosa]|uniref:ABC transporter ATP-binding protein n=1 Tax=Anaerolinea thermolimosa TaxID=229919 RepID=UPI0009FBAA20|nr:ABC transporter ATP-binding protein [Anaerolinea thermolimosa]GAP05954.1 ABC-type antimicrobial peptide transport system, ATPase component [Anaerolinea thermolimosa]
MATNRPDAHRNFSAPLIEVQELNKVFHTAAGEARVLKNISLTISAGEFVSIIGRSGSGKSTLINMLTGIDHPTSGEVRIEGVSLHGMDEGQLAKWRGRTLGIVFQFFQLLPMLTLLENVLLPMDFCDFFPPEKREERALQLLDMVGLKDLAHRLPGAVSGGQQQCAAVARALANDAPIIMADEPTGNLDSASAEQVMSLFEDLVRQGKTILMVTHDRELARRANRTLLISDGELVHEAITHAFRGLPDEVLLQLSRSAVQETYEPGAWIAGVDGKMSDVLVVERGELLITEERGGRFNGDVLRVLPGQWVDLRWFVGGRGKSRRVRAGLDGGAWLLRLNGSLVDQLTPGHTLEPNPFSPGAGGRG